MSLAAAEPLTAPVLPPEFEFVICSHGTGDGQLSGPRRSAFDSSGRLAVAEALNDRVTLFAKNGTFIASFGTHGLARNRASSLRPGIHDRCNGGGGTDTSGSCEIANGIP